MPALPPAANVARIQMRFSLGTDSNIINTFHSAFTGLTDEPSLNNWSLAIRNAWKTHLGPSISTGCTLTAVTIEDLTSNTSAVGSDVSEVSAGSGGTSSPSTVALVTSFQINRRYRGGHPRQYIAGVPASHLADEDHWDTTPITGFIVVWEAAYTLFMAAVKGFTSGTVNATNIVNVSYVQNHTWEQDQHGNWHKIPTYRPTPHIDIVNGYIAQPRIGTIRRRAV